MMDGVEQTPLEGTSLVYTFDNAAAPTRHTTQYFELVGNRAIYKDGWMASTTPLRLPWVTIGYRNPTLTTSSGSCTTSTKTSVRRTTLPRRIPTS